MFVTVTSETIQTSIPPWLSIRLSRDTYQGSAGTRVPRPHTDVFTGITADMHT